MQEKNTNTTKGLVSIIIPVYNVEKYLRECIQSAIEQTYNNIEVILVDDGSPDDCPQVCDEYASLDHRVRTVHQDNRGLSAARNTGLAAAKGEYIYFLDSDDFIREDAIQTLIEEADGKGLDVVVFDALVTGEDGRVDESNRYYIRDGRYDVVDEGKTLFAEMLRNFSYKSSVPLLFIRHSCLINNNLSFYEGILHEDELFTFLLLMQCNRTGHLPKTLYYRRMRSDSIMTSPSTENNFLGYLCVFGEMVNFYRQHYFSAVVDEAVRSHIVEKFNTTYSRYIRLSKIKRAKNEIYKKQLFLLMRTSGICSGMRIVLYCLYQRLYKIYCDLGLVRITRFVKYVSRNGRCWISRLHAHVDGKHM